MSTTTPTPDPARLITFTAMFLADADKLAEKLVGKSPQEMAAILRAEFGARIDWLCCEGDSND